MANFWASLFGLNKVAGDGPYAPQKELRPEIQRPNSYAPEIRQPLPQQRKPLNPVIINKFNQNRRTIGDIIGAFGKDSRTAVALAMAESGFDPEASNYNKSSDSYDDGLYQANSKWQADNPMYVSREYQRNPSNSIRFAADLAKRDNGFKKWAAYNSGDYKKYLPYVDYLGDPYPLD